MRILVDATPLLLRSAGVKGYLWHWIRALRAEAPAGSIGTFPHFEEIPALDHEHSLVSRWRTLTSLAAVHAGNKLWLPVIEWAARKASAVHLTNQVRRAPLGKIVTATLHDLTCWTMPELHTRANLRADREFAARVLTRATGLIAVSESTRRDAVEYLRVPPERIVTIHSGVAEAFFQVSEREARAVTERLALPKPYVLFVGTLEPRKNLDRLLDAWLALPGDLRQAYDLAIAGPAGWAAPATLARLDSVSSSVRRLGYVQESDLPALTRGAALGVYPSLYEGFGFFVAQAMACGVAVLTSNVSSLPEIGGDGCMYIDPLSRGELAAALRVLLESPARREQLGAKGRALAAERYRWSLCARRSLDFFRSLGAL